MTIFAIAALLLVTLLALLAWRHPPFTASIVDPAGRPLPGSIASLEWVVLGGVERRVLTRGHSIANPVLLNLHGGPGTAELGTAGWSTTITRPH